MFSTIRYSLLFITSTAIAVILWLSVSFWVDAYAQRSDAEWLLVSSKADGDLLNVMRKLSALRDDQYTDLLDEAAEVEQSRESIRSLVSTHVASLEQAIEQLTENQKTEAVVERTLGSRRTVAVRLEELVEAVGQWENASEFVMQDGQTLAPVRDSVKNALWTDNITSVLDRATALLQASRYIPYRTYLDTTSLRDLRFYTWQLSDLITQERLQLAELDPQAYSARTPISYPLQTLRSRIVSVSKNLYLYTDSGIIHASIGRAIESLDANYFKATGKIMLAESRSGSMQDSGADPADSWRLRSTEMIYQLKELDQIIGDQLSTGAELLKQHAIRQLVIDSGLVILCFGLIVAAVWTNKRLLEAAGNELKRAEAFSRLSHIIYDAPEINSIVDNLCRSLMEGFGAAEAGVFKYSHLQVLDQTAAWRCVKGQAQAISTDCPGLYPTEIEMPKKIEITASRSSRARWVLGLFGVRQCDVGSTLYIPLNIEEHWYSLIVVRRSAEQADFTQSDIHAIDSLVEQLSTSLQRQQLAHDIKHQANHDALTGLPNRAAFERRLQQTISEQRSIPVSCSVLFIDLDGFKNVNDTHGHALGDRVLQDVGSRFQYAVRAQDYVARIGGDEFAVLLLSTESDAVASMVAQKLIDSLEHSFESDAIRLGASIGISMFPAHGNNSSDLLKYADMAMYHAKARGSNSIQLYSSELAQAYQDRISMGHDLALAVSLNQLELYYQPQVDALSREVIGVEALIRWNHPQRGQVSPFEFIPLAEQLGLITEIGAWVIDEACRQTALWHENGLPNLRMAVNISTQQFNSSEFVNTLLNSLDESGVSPALFEIELTESLMMQDISSVVSRLRTLRGIGIQVAIDDFGTGYSSLQYLDDLPLDVLKIDRAFISRLSTSESDNSLAQSIAAMARTLSLRTVAEGVESEEQLHRVIAIGCDVVQGYYYSRPVPAADIPATIFRINAADFVTQNAA